MITLAERKGTPKGTHKKGKVPTKNEKGQFVSPINGQPVPKGKPFVAGDPRAREAQKLSAISKREKGDLRRMCQVFLEEVVTTDKDGHPVTGGELMLQSAIAGLKKGNPRFWELMRDTAGFKPVDKVVVSEVDPDVIREVEQMIKEGTEDEQEAEAAVEECGAPVSEGGSEGSEVHEENEPDDQQNV